MQTAPNSNPAEECRAVIPCGVSSRRQIPASDSSLVVSIHDVSPVTRTAVTRILADLMKIGVPVTSLLVIPNHHHKAPIAGDPDFGAWLRGLVQQGNEVVLHGFHHLRSRVEGEGLATRLMTRSYTAGEGEFYDLPYGEASELLAKGRAALRLCGLEERDVPGFIAPAWLLGTDAERAVRDAGFRYTTRIGCVIDCATRRQFPARSMVYSVRAFWRRAVSLLWNEILFQKLRGSPLLRIGLHPPDWEHPGIRRHALACIRLAAARSKVTTYRDWLDRRRDSRHQGSRPF